AIAANSDRSTKRMRYPRFFTPALTATLAAALWFGTEPAAAICGRPPTKGPEPACRLGTHLICTGPHGPGVIGLGGWTYVPDPKVYRRTESTMTKAPPPPLIENPMTRPPGPPKPMPWSRVR